MFRKRFSATTITSTLVLLSACHTPDSKNDSTTNNKPNVLLILADDMGFSDLGCFGSEIKTPNLDKLAREGMRMVQFYNAARCCPSRAGLLTGQYPHAAGMGSMTDQDISIPSYQGYLKDDVLTIAQVLKPAGYNNYLVGKWHVGDESHHWPHNYAFDRCYADIGGAGSYFNDEPYRSKDWKWSDGKIVFVEDSSLTQYPDGDYKTDVFTRYANQYIEMEKDNNSPFFMYLAYTAPHWPLHALPEDIEKYAGTYMMGWDSLRKIRFERQKALGLFDDDVKLSEPEHNMPAWSTLTREEKMLWDKKMAVYAAMVDRMDQGIGKIIEKLRETGQLENTIILFISDNGAARAHGVGFLREHFTNNMETLGTAESFIGYGPGWANASNTPFRRYKAEVHEGGIASPFIAWYPNLIAGKSIHHTPAHIIDILPTLIELSGASYPKEYEGIEVRPLPGKSLVSLFQNQHKDTTRRLGFAHSANYALRKGPWKLVKLRQGNWELYNIENDRTETHNLIETADPALIQELMNEMWEWSANVGVVPQDIVKARTTPGGN